MLLFHLLCKMVSISSFLLSLALRGTCDIKVQKRSGADGFWYDQCLEDFQHQWEVQVSCMDPCGLCVIARVLLQKPQFTCGRTLEFRLSSGVLFVKSKCMILSTSWAFYSTLLSITEVESDAYSIGFWNLPFCPLQACSSWHMHVW